MDNNKNYQIKAIFLPEIAKTALFSTEPFFVCV